MDNDNGFDLLIAVVFAMSPQLGGLGPKYQYLVISLFLGEEENILQFHIRALHIRSETFLLQEKTGKINNLTGEYIMELSKLSQEVRQ